MVEQKIRGRGDNFAVDLLCENTGKPLSITNDNGMYCSERCDEAVDIAAKSKRRELINKAIDSIEW